MAQNEGLIPTDKTGTASQSSQELMGQDPLGLFAQWLKEAEQQEPNDPTAMCLATADAEGRPSARMVLLKAFDERGFTFFTNSESRKGQEIRENCYGALCFHWKSLRRQVRIEGVLALVSAQDSDAYFASRSRGSQIGAWASQQSRPLENRASLLARAEDMRQRFDGQDVPRPAYWQGYRLKAQTIEFWRDGAHRLHERGLYRHDGDGWRFSWLYP
jgi:pyridoxamine 5'-phosphate oxidase